MNFERTRFLLLTPPVALAANALDKFTYDRRQALQTEANDSWSQGRTLSWACPVLPWEHPQPLGLPTRTAAYARFALAAVAQAAVSLLCAPAACLAGARAFCLGGKEHARDALAQNYLPLCLSLHLVGALLAVGAQQWFLSTITRALPPTQ